MKILLRHVSFATAVAAMLAGASVASAANYPDRTIRIVVGFPPGGVNDIVARILGQKMSEDLGQAVVVDNRAGAGGTIGADLVAKAKPDGYELLLGSVSNLAMAPSQYKNLAYDPTKSFSPIARVAASPNILVVNPALPVHSVKDLVALAKQKPGTIYYASAGNGTSNHLTGELFKMMAGINLVHVPYKGDGPGLADVMAGHVQMMFPTLPAALPLIKAGKVRAIAVSSAKRSALLPDVPTVAESGGLPEFAVSVWVGILGPAGLPASVVDKLNGEIRHVVTRPDVRQKLAVAGAEPDPDTPAEFAAYLAAETAKWSKIAVAAHIQPK